MRRTRMWLDRYKERQRIAAYLRQEQFTPHLRRRLMEKVKAREDREAIAEGITHVRD